MITRKAIRGLCTSVVYGRGLDIYRSGTKISEFQVEEEAKTDVICAVVKGSGRKYYHVSARYNREKGCLETIGCECAAFRSYYGICKHCAAVLLEYIDYGKQKEADEQYEKKLRETARSQDTAGLRESVRLPEPVRPTTSSLKQLLDKQYLRRTTPFLDKDMYGKVCLVPYLTYSGQRIQVEFQIGVTRMYVLKDIFEFVRNMEGGRRFSYGQKLEFVHNMDAFQEDSRAIVQFILNWYKRNGSRYIQEIYRSTGYSGIAPKLRSLKLSEMETEELLEARIGKTIIAQVESQGEKTWKVAEGTPRCRLIITGEEEGITLKTEECCSINGIHKRIYFSGDTIFLSPREEVEAEDFIACMEQLPGNQAFIHRRDVPAFGRELLPVLEKYFICEKKQFEAAEYGIFPVKYEVYLDSPQKDWITCKALAVYGENKYSLYAKNEGEDLRDMAGEMVISSLLSQYFNAFDEEKKELALSGDEEKMYLLLTEGIGVMQEYAEVYISEALKKIRILESPRIRMGVSLSAGLLELDIQTEDMDRSELMEILSRYSRRKKYYRLKDGSFLNMAGEQMQTLIEMKSGLHLTQKQMLQKKLRLPAYRALYLDQKLRNGGWPGAVKDKKFRSLIRSMKTAQDNDFEIPQQQEEILREYQKQGFLWMKTLRQNGFGGILADDMGLGKTLQVITLLCSEYVEKYGTFAVLNPAGKCGTADEKARGSAPEERWLCLIVTPASLVYNWESEIQRFAPGLPVEMVTGTASQREEILKDPGREAVLITSYELLRRDIDKYEGLSFACQVIDEAQYIKNHGTQAAKAVKRVKAAFRMALTGTPVENRLSELWSIFDYLMPGFLYTYEQFRTELELPVVQNGDEKARERLQRMIRPFVLRRLKKDVLRELPDKLEKNMFVRLEGEQQRLYDAHVKRLRTTLDRQSEEEYKMSKIQILAEITKLRQICCHPGLLYEDYQGDSAKLSMCMELISNAVNGGHKLLLFSQFTSMLELLQKELEKAKISYYMLTGSTSKEKRRQLVEAFNQDETSVFCISLKAGGTGLNLTAADIVIHYDPWWNLAVQNQATDRAHRIGQKNVVSVYRLFAKGTIEEKIRMLQEKKMELADQILGGEGLDGAALGREEMLELLKL